MESNRKVALCILTYNNSDVISDVWDRNIYYYDEMGIDVYFFDSSADDKTEYIIESYISKGLDNVFYERLDSELTYDEKLMYVMSEYKFTHDYKYIWPSKYRTCIGNILYDHIVSAMKDNHDVIFLGASGDRTRSELYDRIYSNSVEFYRDWGWLVTSLDVSIYKMECIRQIDWKHFKDTVKWNKDYAFTQYALVFYIIDQGNCDVYSMDVYSLNYFYSSSKAQSQWHNIAVDVWVYRWYKANEWLQGEYIEYKNDVMKRATSLPWILGNKAILIRLCMEKKLNIKKLREYANIWDEVCTVAYSEVEMMAEGRYEELKNNIYNNILSSLEKGDIRTAVTEYTDNEWIRMLGDNSNSEYLQVGQHLNMFIKKVLDS